MAKDRKRIAPVSREYDVRVEKGDGFEIKQQISSGDLALLANYTDLIKGLSDVLTEVQKGANLTADSFRLLRQALSLLEGENGHPIDPEYWDELRVSANDYLSEIKGGQSAAGSLVSTLNRQLKISNELATLGRTGRTIAASEAEVLRKKLDLMSTSLNLARVQLKVKIDEKAVYNDVDTLFSELTEAARAREAEIKEEIAGEQSKLETLREELKIKNQEKGIGAKKTSRLAEERRILKDQIKEQQQSVSFLEEKVQQCGDLAQAYQNQLDLIRKIRLEEKQSIEAEKSVKGTRRLSSLSSMLMSAGDKEEKEETPRQIVRHRVIGRSWDPLRNLASKVGKDDLAASMDAAKDRARKAAKTATTSYAAKATEKLKEEKRVRGESEDLTSKEESKISEKAGRVGDLAAYRELSGTFKSVAGGILKAVAAAFILKKAWDGVKALVDKVASTIKNAFAKAITTTVDLLKKGFLGGFRVVLGLGTGVLKGLIGAARGIFKGVTSIAKGAFGRITSFFKSVWARMMEISGPAAELTRVVGKTSVASMGKVRAAGQDSIEKMNNLREIAESIEVDPITFFNSEDASTAVSLKKQLGLSAEQAGNLAMNAKLAGVSAQQYEDDIEAAYQNSQKQSTLEKGRYRVTAELSMINKKVLSASKEMTVAFGLNNKRLAESVMQAAKLGLELEDLKGIANSMLDFESSIGNEMQAQLLTGKQLNLSAARMYALEGDYANLAGELAKQDITAAEYGKMNLVQREAVAKALGMSNEQMAKMLIQQDKSGKLTEAQKARLMGLTIEEYKAVSLQDSWNNMINAMKESFIPVIKQFLPIILKVLTAVVGLMRTIAPILTKAAQMVLPLVNEVWKIVEDLLNAIANVDMNPILQFLKNIIAGVGVLMKALTGTIGVRVLRKNDKAQEAGQSLGSVEGNPNQERLSREPDYSGLMTFFVSLGESLGGIVSTIADVFSKVGPAIGEAFFGVLPLLGELLAGIVPLVQELISSFGTVFKDFVEAIVPVLREVIPLVKPLLEPIVGIISLLIKEIVPVGQSLIQTLVPALKEFAPFFGQLIQGMGGFLMEFIKLLAPALEQLIATIKPFIKPLIDVLTTVLGLVADILPTIVSTVVPLVEILAPAIKDIIGTLAPALVSLIPTFGEILTDVLRTLAPIFVKLAPVILNLLQVLEPIFDTVATVIEELAEPLADIIQGLTPVLVDIVKPLCNLIKALMPVVSEIMKALAPVLPLVANLIIGILPPLIDLTATVLELINPLVKHLLPGLALVSNLVVTAINKAIHSIYEFFHGLPDKVKEAWASIEKWFGDKISKAGNILRWIGGWLSEIGNLMRELPKMLFGSKEDKAELKKAREERQAQLRELNPFKKDLVKQVETEVVTYNANMPATTEPEQHAGGGLVSGSSFIGDKIQARLNSGEMVLNTEQQKNLFWLIDTGFKSLLQGKTIQAVAQNESIEGNRIGQSYIVIQQSSRDSESESISELREELKALTATVKTGFSKQAEISKDSKPIINCDWDWVKFDTAYSRNISFV